MTMTGAPAGTGRERLAARDLRRNLTAMLVRRLPADDVDDVAQTVLCDALASDRVPQDPTEMRRWLVGIARHKVADFHRARARTEKRTAPLDDEGRGEPACPPPPVEARKLLASVLATAESPRDRETLDWLVREHHGCRLADIAREAGLPSPVVRQRVSRLRRALKARWAGAIAVAFLALGGLAMARYLPRANERFAIGPDPSLAKVDEARLAAGQLDGVWTVVSYAPSASLTPAARRLLDAEIASAAVEVRGGRVIIHTRSSDTTLTARQVTRDPDGAIHATLVTASGAAQRVRTVPEGRRLRVVVEGGRLAGEAILRR